MGSLFVLVRSAVDSPAPQTTVYGLLIVTLNYTGDVGMKHFVVVAMLVGSSTWLLAQPSCYTEYPSYYQSMPSLTALPPLSGGMSLNELIGHIAIDSICRLKSYTQIDSFMQARVTWDDTLKSMLKYMTTIVDRNPLLVFGISAADCEPRLSFPKEVRSFLARSIAKHSPYPNLDAGIASADYILTVSISDTSGLTDTSAQFAKTAIVATGNIVDTIFGRVFPFCSTQQLQPSSNGGSSQCITFDVSRENLWSSRDDKLLSSADTIIDQMVPQPSKQYLVFLKLVRLCVSTSDVYFTLYPMYWIGPRCGIYEIQAGRITDEQDYFGLGSNPLVQDVVSAIESRIQQIKTWVR